MADLEQTHDEQEEPWEERSLHLLSDSKIDQEFSEAKAQKSGQRKHKMRWMKRPMAIPNIILELQEDEFRETALRCLSNYLLERREEEPDNYYRTGFFLFHSCCSMTILLQEVVTFYRKMVDGSLNVRSSKRLANVLTLFQSVAANKETRQKFVASCVPNFLVPVILFDRTLEVFDNVRAISLSVIGILCQFREPEIIQWAIESNMVEVCRIAVEIGNELSKVVAMHILEAILQDKSGISYICSPICDHILGGLMGTWKQLVELLAIHQDFSPRLLFHIIRCYVLLCVHARGLDMVMENLPDPLTDGSLNDILEEFPIIRNLLNQLLLNVGREVEVPKPGKEVHVQPMEEMTAFKLDQCMYSSTSDGKSPLRVIDLNKENWFQTPDRDQVEVYSGKENT